jgi:hypothetical protein
VYPPASTLHFLLFDANEYRKRYSASQHHLICLPLSFFQGKPLVLLAEIVDELAEELLVRRGWEGLVSKGEVARARNTILDAIPVNSDNKKALTESRKCL